ncbi:MAG: Antilisterial bacteriocin subtilosin biosynthesis protein AlbA [Candidatus Ordinivivax streblomastigis]|uniref:Antilisterial bacteriocin subtilosin biosynthesis protein AlbA n=1 Tax=Candidatus Ordinivivax streblomastigis TaxID=2540710 RepID=A0A5M8P295_9BACT|nr:MAG: Antilisterial bacteriocin subtilosin biosynthesis protein AlbA [Candidatus Ordinivivax streblomastigis]
MKQENFSLEDYLDKAIRQLMADALSAVFNNPKESLFVLKMQKVFKKSEKRRRIYLEKENLHIPPFLISSISNICNLTCKGCYAHANSICNTDKQTNTPKVLSAHQWKKLFEEAVQMGINFNLLTGGEPLLQRDIIQAASEVSDMIFPIFTNGTVLNESYLDFFSKHLHLIPVLSLEGDGMQTDKRRGKGVYERVVQVMEQMKARKLFYGTSLTVTTENMQTITSLEYMEHLQQYGCKIVFFVEYVPAEANTTYLALDAGQIIEFESRLENLRSMHKGILFLSFPGDEKAAGGCLAAGRGFLHINPEGKAEACPFSPYSDRNITDSGLKEALKSPFFAKLRESGLVGGEHTGGCTLFEHNEEVQNFLTMQK